MSALTPILSSPGWELLESLQAKQATNPIPLPELGSALRASGLDAELVVAVLILAVTLLELFLLGEGTLSQVLGGSFSADAFFADAMTIVVGIEFVKMLMLHTPRAVTDVLLFAIARQLVVNHSSAVDTLLGVAAVALIFVIKKFLHTDGDDAPAGDGRP